MKIIMLLSSITFTALLTGCISNQLMADAMKSNRDAGSYVSPECEKKWTNKCFETIKAEMDLAKYRQPVGTFQTVKNEQLQIEISERGRIYFNGNNLAQKRHASSYFMDSFKRDLTKALELSAKMKSQNVTVDIDKKISKYLSFQLRDEGKLALITLVFINDAYKKIDDIYLGQFSNQEIIKMISTLDSKGTAKIQDAKQARSISSAE